VKQITTNAMTMQLY